ncbi:MAG TPA: hypothetical protein VGM88_32500 [Kofleriaceae bacterium]|jgi:hypothetical protein
MMKHSILLLPLVFGAACLQRDKGGDTDTAESAIDSSDSAEAEGNLMMAAVDGSPTSSANSITADAVASAVAANISARFPGGCATVTTSGADVTVTYADCTGPRGLVHVTGDLDLAFTITGAGDISVHGTASGLRVNGATIDVDSTGTYAVSGASHSLTVQTTGDGVGPFGNSVAHDGDYTITWDESSECASLDGHWDTEIASAERSNDVSLARCAGGCPTGSITHHYLDGASISIDFDGSSVATWSASTGASGSVQLTCQ